VPGGNRGLNVRKGGRKSQGAEKKKEIGRTESKVVQGGCCEEKEESFALAKTPSKSKNKRRGKQSE